MNEQLLARTDGAQASPGDAAHAAPADDGTQAAGADRPRVLMIAYTNYRTDPRVIRQAEAAARAGYAVDFIALRREDDPPQEVINGVRVIHVNQLRYRGRGRLRYLLAYAEFFLRCALRSTALHLAHRYGVVHVNNMPDALIFAALGPRLLGARLVLDIHDPMPNVFASKYGSGDRGWLFRLLLWQERASAWLADAVLTVSEPVKRHLLVEQHGMDPHDITVVANFADDRLFAFREPPALGRPIRMVFHGTILERYGLRGAMQALAKVRDRGALHLTLIGEGDFSDALKSLIGALGIGDMVTFDNRMYPLHEMPGRLAGFDLGFVPMERSSVIDFALPLKLLEYTSLGLPSIAVRNVAVQHYFGEDDCLYYDPTSVDSLTAVLDRIAADPQIVRAYAQRIPSIRPQLVWSGQAEQYVGLLDRLASRRGAS
jgi:glycosyltransferase involved in cell wall biosynthesis